MGVCRHNHQTTPIHRAAHGLDPWATRLPTTPVLVARDPRVKPAGSAVRVDRSPTKPKLIPAPSHLPYTHPHSRTSTARSRRTVGAGNAGGVGVVLPRWATPSVSAEKPPPLVRSRRKYRRDGEALPHFIADYPLEAKASPSPHKAGEVPALRCRSAVTTRLAARWGFSVSNWRGWCAKLSSANRRCASRSGRPGYRYWTRTG